MSETETPIQVFSVTSDWNETTMKGPLIEETSVDAVEIPGNKNPTETKADGESKTDASENKTNSGGTSQGEKTPENKTDVSENKTNSGETSQGEETPENKTDVSENKTNSGETSQGEKSPENKEIDKGEERLSAENGGARSEVKDGADGNAGNKTTDLDDVDFGSEYGG
ncbi:hypothetical protein ACOMHN_025750 [Nucella lapillus]